MLVKLLFALIVVISITISFFYFNDRGELDNSIEHQLKFEKDNSINISFFDFYQFNRSFGQASYGLSSADFNDDGLMDFAASYATSPFNYSTISLFYNQGNLTFGQKDIFKSNFSYIQDLEVADFDNDGDIDLIFSFNEHQWVDDLLYNTNGTIILLLNDGKDNFLNLSIVSRRTTDTINNPEIRINPQLSSSDYDKDGDIDLIVGDNSGRIELFLNNGVGVFESNGIIDDFGSVSWGLTSVDVNNDTNIDIVAAASTGNEYSLIPGYLYFIKNIGDKNCFSSSNYSIIGNIPSILGTGCLVTLDITNDGNIEIFMGISDEIYIFKKTNNTYNSDLLYRFPKNSKGNLEDLSRGGLDVGDFNNNGLDDFITGGCQGVIRLFINKGDQIHSN